MLNKFAFNLIFHCTLQNSEGVQLAEVHFLRADRTKKVLINFLVEQVMTLDILSKMPVGSIRAPVFINNLLIIREFFSMAFAVISCI